jgi:hypothetical protein
MRVDFNSYRVTVLCEDDKHIDFIRAYLGISKRKIKRISEAFNNATVLSHYPNAVKSHRQLAQQNVILVVMIDADEKNVQWRLREFDQKLDAEKFKLNQKTRLDDENILIFVPIRNIESWFYYIDSGDFCVEDENSEGEIPNYKKQYIGIDFKRIEEITQKLKTICDKGLPEKAPSSLHHACDELKRLKI